MKKKTKTFESKYDNAASQALCGNGTITDFTLILYVIKEELLNIKHELNKLKNKKEDV